MKERQENGTQDLLRERYELAIERIHQIPAERSVPLPYRDFFTQMAEMTGTLWEHSQLSCSLNHGFASMAAVYIDRCAQ